MQEFDRQSKDTIYRLYISDLLYGIARKSGIDVQERYTDIINKQKEEKTQKSAKEVIEMMKSEISKLGGER